MRWKLCYGEYLRRKLMMYVGSNWYLTNKKVALTSRKPLDLLRSTTRNPNWRAVAGDVWNYFSIVAMGSSA